MPLKIGNLLFDLHQFLVVLGQLLPKLLLLALQSLLLPLQPRTSGGALVVELRFWRLEAPKYPACQVLLQSARSKTKILRGFLVRLFW
ncbi:MAG: hypothetical protein EBY17_27455 [Acidobacteriia bacterium]|nr:hypothetical protein [Terriglobia bacterium]